MISEPRPIEIFIPEIKSLLSARNFDELKGILSEINSIDLADGFERFPPEQQLLLLRLLKPDRAVEVFEELDIPQQQYIIQHLDDATLAPLLEGVPPEVTARILKKLPARCTRKMSELLKHEQFECIQSAMEFPANSAGALMQTDLIPIHPDMTVRAALERIQAASRIRKEKSIDHLYVTNGGGKLAGGLPLNVLISAPADMRVRDLMTPVSFFKIPVDMDQEEAAKIFSKYKLPSAPVVDADSRLIGTLSANDIIEVIEEETTEDIQKLAGVEVLDKPYFQVTFREMIRKRAAWLCVLFLSESLTAVAMGYFEGEIAKAVVLALFIPLIISSGGNSGSQASTLIVRALALREVTFGDWWRVMRREFVSGLTLGVILGSIGFGMIFIRSQFMSIYGPHYMLVGATVALALVLVVLWGSLCGSLLPIILKRLGFDPAVASAPFVATLVDVTGLVIYFLVGMAVLKGTLL